MIKITTVIIVNDIKKRFAVTNCSVHPEFTVLNLLVYLLCHIVSFLVLCFCRNKTAYYLNRRIK